jgi:hypothetical protein
MMEQKQTGSWVHYPRRPTVIIVVIFCLVSFWFLFRVVAPSAQRLTHGYSAYYSSSRLLAAGELSAEVYDPDSFRPYVRRDSYGEADDIFNANPPTTTLMFLPVALLPTETVRRLWTWLNAILLFGGLALLLFTFSRQTRLETSLAILVVAMLFQPVIQNFFFGQAYVLVFFLLCLAAVAWPRPEANLDGGILVASALALALLLKTAGLSLLPLLAWQKRWRTLGALLALTLLVILLTLPLFPLTMWQAYRELLDEATNGPWRCVTAYQTTRSLLCHLFSFQGQWNPSPVDNLPWLADGLFWLLALLGLAVIFLRGRRQSTAAFMAVIAWSIVFAPIGEQHHHTIMLIPLVWLILQRPAGRLPPWLELLALVVVLAFYLAPFDVNHPGLQPGWRAVLAYPRLYGAWIIMLLSIYHLRAPATETVARTPLQVEPA